MINVKLDNKAVKTVAKTLDLGEGGGSTGEKKTRTLALSGDIQCYSGYVQFIYESEDDTVSYSYDGEAETNPIVTHLMSELADGREIHGYGYWEEYASESYKRRHPLKMYIDTNREEPEVMFEALDNSGFDCGIDSLIGCDIIND